MNTIDKLTSKLDNFRQHLIVAFGAWATTKVQVQGARKCKSVAKAVDKITCPLEAATIEALADEKLRQAEALYNIAIEGKLTIAARAVEDADEEVLNLQETLEELKQLVSDTAHDLRLAKAALKAAEQHHAKVEAEVTKQKV